MEMPFFLARLGSAWLWPGILFSLFICYGMGVWRLCYRCSVYGVCGALSRLLITIGLGEMVLFYMSLTPPHACGFAVMSISLSSFSLMEDTAKTGLMEFC
jgi:hypothetical protein